jgi:hypothetical protein
VLRTADSDTEIFCGSDVNEYHRRIIAVYRKPFSLLSPHVTGAQHGIILCTRRAHSVTMLIFYRVGGVGVEGRCRTVTYGGSRGCRCHRRRRRRRWLVG